MNTIELTPRVENRAPMSFGQEALWFLSKLAPESRAYHLCGAARVVSPCDAERLERAFAALSERHPVLRTTFGEGSDGKPEQRIGSGAGVVFSREIAEDAEALNALLARHLDASFDLERGPLVRAGLITAGGETVLWLAAHHLVADFWSLAVMLRDLGRAYATGDEIETEGGPQLSYAEWARWQRERTAGETGQRELAVWKEILAGELPRLELPTDRPRRAKVTWVGGSVDVFVGAEATRRLGRIARGAKSNLFSGLLAAFQAFLSRLSGQDDLIVGTPTTGRFGARVDTQVGYFVNPVPVRADLSGDPSFVDLLARQKPTIEGALALQAYPFSRLAEEIQPERDPGRSPIFDAMLAYEKARGGEGFWGFALGLAGTQVDLGGLALESLRVEPSGSPFDLSLAVSEVGGGLAGSLRFSSELFDRATIERWAGWLVRWIEGAAAEPELRLSDLPLLSPLERQELRLESEPPAVAFASSALVHDLLARHARERPGELAVESEHEPGRRYTWGEAAAHTDRLARRLAGLGAGPEKVVGVSLERSVDRVLSIYAIWKAGACYLPVDPELPAERRALLLSDAGAVVVIARAMPSKGAGWIGSAAPLLLSKDRGLPVDGGPEGEPRAALPENLAYVIYTSGSTGVPKGVGISHRDAAGHFAAAAGFYGMDSTDRVVQFASASFDVSMEQVGVALASGGTLVVRGPELPPPLDLSDWMTRWRITNANLPTAVWTEWSRAVDPLPKDLRVLVTGGEAMTPAAAERFRRRMARMERPPVVYNGYGPTEAVVTATCFDLADLAEGDRPDSGSVPIGRLLPGRSGAVVDRTGVAQPFGIPGELVLGGLLARGYLDRPDLTAERFRPDPLTDKFGERVYRTGDRVRQRGDGTIEYLGRIDHQIKIRGVRIEPGEIEAALDDHPGVKDSIVLAREDPNAPNAGKRLIAWYRPIPDEAVTAADLRQFLAARLPQALVPAAFVEVADWPVGPTGKIDRRALPEPENDGAGAIWIAPRTPTEQIVAGLFTELLGTSAPGAEADFFALGGHSLLAAQLVSRLRRAFGVEVPLGELFAGSTVAAIAERIDARAGAPQAPPLLRIAQSPEAALSFGEERLWFLDRLDPGRATYNIGFRLALGGPLDSEALAGALREVIARHSPLRTRYADREGRPYATIPPPESAWRMPFVDLSTAISTERAKAEAARIAEGEGRRPFDLARGPLLRASLVRRSADLHDSLYVFHHIATDGWSLGVFSRELAELYGAAVEGRSAKLPELAVEYADWAAWQRGWLSGEVYERELSWWRERLSGAPEVLDLPLDRPRSSQKNSQGRRSRWVRRELSAELTEAIAARSRAAGSTPFMVLLAAWAGVLSRLGAGTDLVLGTVVANRNLPEIEGLIGFFVNSLAVRISAEGEPTLGELLERTRAAALGAYAHQELPLDRLVAELGGGARWGGVPPLYQASLVLQNLPEPVLLPGLSTAIESLDGGVAKLDLSLVLSPIREGGTERLAAELELNLDLFDPATGARLLAGFERMAAELAALPEKALADAELLGPAERHQLLIEWREGDVAVPPLLMHEWIAKHARERPAALALESEHEPGRRYSWFEVAAHTDRLARRLAGLGAGPEGVVAVSLERSVDRVLAMFAIWKAGACYLPVDPELPLERRALLLEDARVVVVMARDVTSGEGGWIGSVTPLLISKESGLPVDAGPEWEPRAAVAENLAYVIYTSGSTGVPKGVGVSHRHAAGHFAAAVGFYRMDATDRVVQFASASFDVSMEQVGVALASGGCLVVRGPELPPPLELSGWMARWGITNANLPTAVWTEWSRSETPLPRCLRVLVTGGEAMTPTAAERFRKALVEMENPPVVYNGYGPTETVVTATCYDLAVGKLNDSGAVSIGRLLPSRTGFVVDPEGRPLPLGGIGELALGGLLARGYLDRPDLTAERFRPDPFTDKAGERLYRTGDRVRQRGDGTFDYLGRIDSQIKIRGFRIEPGEIEAALARHPVVQEAIVLAREIPNLGLTLIAWVRPLAAFDSNELRRYLAARLPSYMVPAAFVEIAGWPLTPTGKIDRRALPDPSFESNAGRIALRTPTEEIVAGLFTELLGVAEIGVEDDFFSLGGHSLLATQLASRIRKTFDVEFPLGELFAAARVAVIAERIDAFSGGPIAPPLKRRKASGKENEGELSFAEERLWFLDRLEPGTATYNVGFRLALDGPLAFAPFVAALSAVVARHARLRTRFGEREGKPFAEADFPRVFPVPRIDLSAIESPTEALRLAAAEGRRPFDLARGPLLRVALLRHAADRHDALFVFHHIVTDGWSISVFSREMAELYAAAIEKRPALLPSLPIEVADWAAWQRDWLSGEVYLRQLAWWRERLAGAPEVLDLPVDRPRPALAKSPSWLVRRELPSALFSSVVARSRAAGATPFMLLLAAWAGLLSRLGAGRDLVIGAPIANRNRAETEGLIGFFINSLALRISIPAEESLGALVERTREAALGAYAHQDFPFDRLVAELGGGRGVKVSPIFQVSLVFQNLPEPVLLPGLTTAIEPLGGGVAKLDLSLLLSPVREREQERLSALLEINLDLFDPATGARLLRGFEAMVGEGVAHPERSLADAELLGQPERHQLLLEWKGKNLDLPPILVHDWIAKHALERPDALALESEHEPGRRMTWAEVATHTDVLARRLAGLGAGPEKVVAVSLERSIDRVLAIYAIWKAGACYLPVDPELPAERRAWLLSHAGAVVLMARAIPSEMTGWIGTVASLLLSKESGLPVDFGPEEDPRAALPENLAYVIYTSGSTGVPKGVGISNRNAAGHFAAACGFYRMDSTDRVVQFASASFDVSMEQVGLALASGGTLVVRGPELPPPLELSAWMTRWGITNANLPTAVWTEWSWSDAPLPRELRNLVTGGEAMTPAAAERFRLRLAEMDPPPVVYNGYGPTETVVTATCYDLRYGRLPESGSVSIGRLLPARTGWVVGETGEVQALGGIGELVLGGLLARGYLDRPDLTAERFRPNPLTDASFGERLYWTGDRVRQRGDGSFDYLGRTDYQIKIRGFRIEPGEIESALGQHRQVKEAIVLAREPAGISGAGQRLIAWVRPLVGLPIDASELRRFLSSRLPKYMVPWAFVEIAEWPLTPTGKIDRGALPDPAAESGGRIALRTPTEEIVAGLFAELLGVSNPGADADFFVLGGHSLLATQLASRLRTTFAAEIALAELFAGSTVAAIAGRIDARAGRPQAPPLLRTVRSGEVELSFGQERLWFLDRLEPGRATYNVGLRLTLEGAFEPPAFDAALQRIVERHAPLRSRFGERDGKPYAAIEPAMALDLPCIDLSAIQSDVEAVRIAQAEGRRLFNLARGPVLRTTLVRRALDRHDALLVFHHIGTDGWSLGVFSRELAELYGAAVERRPAILPALPIEYADWAAWQRGWMAGEVYDAQLAWWRERLSGAPESLELPADRPRPLASPRRPVAVLRRELPHDLSKALAARARSSGSTPFMALFTSWAALLTRLGAGDDLVIGTAVANRNRAETEGLIGFFVNSLAIRIATNGPSSFVELLSRVREAALSSYAHQDFPFDRLVAELGGVRGGHAPPIYQVSMVFQNLPEPALLPGLATTFEEIGGETAKLDLALTVLPTRAPDEGLSAILELNLDLFDPATGTRLLAGFEAMARELAEHPERRLAEVELLGRAERHQLLIEWNAAECASAPKRIHDFLFRNASERPEGSALESEDPAGRRYSWAELDAVTGRLARKLAGLGAGPERVVGVSLERGVDRQVAILSIWKAGACYLPVDPELPRERRSLLLRDAGAVVLVLRGETSEGLEWIGSVAPLLLSKEGGLPVDHGPEGEPRAAVPENLAYLLYTSGSTGVPKGVAVTHCDAAEHFGAAARFYDLGADDRIVQFAEASFDVSMEQLGLALVCGATLVVRGPEMPAELPAWLDWLGITDANLPTAVWNEWAFSDAPLPEKLRVLVVGGEAMTPAAAARFREKLAASANPPRLWNAYGPTETVVTATCQDVAVGRLGESGAVAIGRALPGRSAFVVDALGEPQALGGIGELVLGGLLARGYLDRPDLTAERFRPDPFAEKAGARVYCTGDRVRQRVDGSFDYLGRTDSQIKLRGIRIEPGEIEAALGRHRQVQEAIVLLRETGTGRRLIAWYRPHGALGALGDGGEIDPADLRRFVAAQLPAALVPSAFVEMAEWPLSPTGKIDRRALPEPMIDRESGERVALRTPTEEIVAGLFASLLGTGPDLSADADFFALGGHSLVATQLASRLRRTFQVEIPLGELFAGSTVAGIAGRIEALANIGAPPPPALLPVPPRPAEIPLSFAQERLWFLDRLEPDPATYNTGFRLTLNGALDEEALAGAFRALIARHEPLRTRFVLAEDRPIQEIAPPEAAACAFRMPRIDLSAAPSAVEAARLARGEGRRPFDLSRGPLLRVVRVTLGRGKSELQLILHHIATDGWSLGVFARELAELYAARVERRAVTLPALPLAYADWAIWQRAWLSGEVFDRELAWWRGRLAGAPEALDLPFDHPRPARPAGLGWMGDGELSADLASRLAARARSAGSTLSMALFAAWAGLLARLGAGTDLVIALPIANRNRAETEGLIGFFVNTLALRIEIPESGVTLGGLLARVREAALPAYAHQDFPFERLVASAGAPHPQVSFAFQNLPAPVLLPGIETQVEELGGGGAKFDLGLIVVPDAEGLLTRIEISLDRLDPATGARLLRGFEAMVGELANDPGRSLAEAELFGPAERHQLLVEWNDADLALPKALVHDWIARHARERPDDPALESEHEPHRRSTWREVEAQADRLARRLAGLGAGPERVVGVSLEWSVDRVLSVYAIWKAGACYLPVDPDLPVERKRLLLADARAVALVARETSGDLGWIGPAALLVLSKENGLPVAAGPEEDPRTALPENLAYLIYTSGSTGVPKGVAVSHRDATGHFAGSTDFYGWRADDRVILLGAISFDLSVDQVGCALAAGATLVVRGPQMPAPADLSRWLGDLRISCATLPTPLFNEWTFAPEPLPKALRMLYAGGEAMSIAAAERFRGRAGLGALLALNAYGPTEAVVAATCHDFLKGRLPESGAVSIGRLLPRRSAYVLDEIGVPVPLGGLGELALGGLLARGYLDRPDLTAERFRPNPFTDQFGARTYRTGDRVRRRGDGSFDYLGRIDGQIKIRGFRIEPGEIEAALAAHSQIKEAIVLVRETPRIGKRLIAWVRPQDALDPGEIARFLNLRLPAYMVPSAFVEIAEWPLSPSGKVDRRALPDPAFETGARSSLRTPSEEIIAGLFTELLGATDPGADSDFFALGGHSLLATQLTSRLRRTFEAELPLAELFAGPTVAGIAERIDALAGRPQESIAPLARSPRPAEVPLSFAQERLWFLDRLEPGTATYNVGLRLTLGGPLVPAALAAALGALVARHEPLRTRYVISGDLPFQRIDPPGGFSLRAVDLERLDEKSASPEAERLAAFEGRRPFDLARGPVLRSALIRRAPERHEVLFVFHHIATDGWSIGVFSRELVELYAAASARRPSRLPPLPIEYADWALWQRTLLAGQTYDRQLAWWRERLAGAPEVLDLSLDRPRPALPRRRARTMRRELSADLSAAVASRARAAGATSYMVLLAAWAGLLSRMGAGSDLVIGLPIANRNRKETEGLIGFFVNSLPVRLSTASDPTLAELLTRARTAALGAYAHQDFPFDRLVAELGGVRGGGVPPIYQVSLMFQNLPEPAMLPGLRTTAEELRGGLAKIDLGLAVVPLREATGDRLAALLELNLDLFDPATGARLLRGFEAILGEVAAHPERALGEAVLIGAPERHQLLAEWNDRDLALAPRVIHDWIARHARERPDDPALESEHEPGRRYSWRQVAFHTDLLARRLAGLGVGPERVVGVALERSVDRVLAMYAIWKAGACYLPVDPDLPVERRALMLEDARAVVLIARDLTPDLLGLSGTVEPLLLSKENGLPMDFGPEGIPRAVLPENLAYMIYTSGSTGVPKGVAVSHRHAAGHFAAAAGFYGMDATDRVVQFAAAGFDVSMEQVGVALASGGTLVVRGPELPPPLELSAWLTRHRITNANLPTAVWTEWSRSEAPLPKDLRVLVTGGEAMTPAAAERFRKRLAQMDDPPVVYNGYGPTETVVTATCYDLRYGRLPESGAVTIGRLLPGRTGIVVDELGEIQPLGGIGELVLGGLLARGYLDRPDLTAERFRPNPLPDAFFGARVYGTGDRVRQRGDGSFDYLGRTDAQIKIRGFRIEPGEIQAALSLHPAIHDAIVLAREVLGAGPRLIAWYRSSAESTAADLRAFLAARLPAYMVPAAFVEVLEWPISATGKIDRQALPEPARSTGTERTPPRTAIHQVIADLWREALPEAGEDLAIEDNFFELGGHSLLAVGLASKVAASFQVELPLKRLFEAPTVAGLGAAVLAAESRQGQSEKIARVLLRMKSLSPEAKRDRLALG
ncbi:MAG: non-ribosomal peptide synthase/polyketide synthase [Acidobacteriota bacterium]